MSKTAFSINAAVLSAALVDQASEAAMKQRLVEAATALCSQAKANCGKDKHQLEPSIHVVAPGQTDSSWPVVDKDGNSYDNATHVTAGENEALVVASTHRKSDGKDYSWYHEQDGLGPSFYMRRAANSVRGEFPDLDISEARPI